MDHRGGVLDKGGNSDLIGSTHKLKPNWLGFILLAQHKHIFPSCYVLRSSMTHTHNGSDPWGQLAEQSLMKHGSVQPIGAKILLNVMRVGRTFTLSSSRHSVTAGDDGWGCWSDRAWSKVGYNSIKNELNYYTAKTGTTKEVPCFVLLTHLRLIRLRSQHSQHTGSWGSLVGVLFCLHLFSTEEK